MMEQILNKDKGEKSAISRNILESLIEWFEIDGLFLCTDNPWFAVSVSSQSGKVSVFPVFFPSA